MGYFVKNKGSGLTPYGTTIPTGDSTTRPTEPVTGILRYNTELNAMEYYDGTSFIQMVSQGSAPLNVDLFTGDASAVVFVMSQPETVSAQVLVYVGGVYQQPSVYTVAGTNIIFSAPPPLDSVISVVHNAGS